MNTSIIFRNFSLARYQLTLQALEPLHLHPMKGSALRGGFGYEFKKLVCHHPQRCEKKCRLGNDCPYGYIFETTLPSNSQLLQLNEGIPRPFIITSPPDLKSNIRPGEHLKFELTLVGTAIKYIAIFIAVFYELGQIGLGRTKGRYCLNKVKAIMPTGEKEIIYDAADELIHGVNSTVTSDVVYTHAATLPADRITLNFLTPTRLKHKGRFVNDGPPFDALIKVLLSRTSSLSYFHCGERLDVDFRGLIDRAAKVNIAHCQTRWEDWSRFSGRQKQRVEMGGLVGQVTYEGDLRDYLPLLALGELIHVGKGTVFGNGQYEIRD